MPCPCGKNTRERLYCHRPDCGTLVAVDLPPPTVDVTPAVNDATGALDVVVHRDGKGRSYRAEGTSSVELVKDAVRKVLADPYSAEWVPKA
jgi:hypothetical protein